MNHLMYRAAYPKSSASLLGLNEWQEKEKCNPLNCAVDENGDLLVSALCYIIVYCVCFVHVPGESSNPRAHALQDNLTLELRVHPPEVIVDNKAHDRYTVVTLTSANRPGSLIHVRALGVVGPVLGVDVFARLEAVRRYMLMAPVQVVQHFTELGLRIHFGRVTSCGGWFVDGEAFGSPGGEGESGLVPGAGSPLATGDAENVGRGVLSRRGWGAAPPRDGPWMAWTSMSTPCIGLAAAPPPMGTWLG